jgi:hypothetical protein
MDSSRGTPHGEAEQQTPPKLSVVVYDEEPEIVALWAAAQQLIGVETRVAALRLLRQYTRTDDLRGAIDEAIEECELRQANSSREPTLAQPLEGRKGAGSCSPSIASPETKH